MSRAMKPMLIKICGLTTPETLDAAIAAGADMAGFVFHPRSPRFLSASNASALAKRAKGRVQTVALVVDPDDDALAAIVAAMQPDLIQLHGTETSERVAAIRSRFALPVMKAVGIARREDLQQVRDWHGLADRILIDAKPPNDAAYPGGHGRPFDWTILDALDPAIPFMLSGGLTPENVGEAIFRVRPAGVDVSSGVERETGVKDTGRIVAFVGNARKAADALANTAYADGKDAT